MNAILLTAAIDENTINALRTDLYSFRRYATFAVLGLAVFCLILLIVSIVQGVKIARLEQGASLPKKKREYKEDFYEDDSYEDDEDSYEDEEESYEDDEDEYGDSYEEEEDLYGADEKDAEDEEANDFVTAAYFARKREEAAERKAAKKAESLKEPKEQPEYDNGSDDDLEIMDLNDL